MSTQRLWSAPAIHLTPIGEDLIGLDTAADRYFCLPAAAAVVQPHADGALDVAAEIRPLLLEQGLARPTPGRPRHMAAAAVRRATPSGRPAPLAVTTAGLQILEATAVFRRLSLAALLEAAAGTRASPLAALPDSLAAYEAALPWTPGEGQCLQRSFILKRYLGRRGIGCDWVFGVRVWPFGAHCWIQVGDAVVGDTLDRTGRYTPILTVS